MFETIWAFAAVHLGSIRRDSRAAGALEYALLCAFIALGIIAGAKVFSSDLSGYFSSLGGKVAAWTTGP